MSNIEVKSVLIGGKEYSYKQKSSVCPACGPGEFVHDPHGDGWCGHGEHFFCGGCGWVEPCGHQECAFAGSMFQNGFKRARMTIGKREGHRQQQDGEG